MLRTRCSPSCARCIGAIALARCGAALCMLRLHRLHGRDCACRDRGTGWSRMVSRRADMRWPAMALMVRYGRRDGRPSATWTCWHAVRCAVPDEPAPAETWPRGVAPRPSAHPASLGRLWPPSGAGCGSLGCSESACQNASGDAKGEMPVGGRPRWWLTRRPNRHLEWPTAASFPAGAGVTRRAGTACRRSLESTYTAPRWGLPRVPVT